MFIFRLICIQLGNFFMRSFYNPKFSAFLVIFVLFSLRTGETAEKHNNPVGKGRRSFSEKATLIRKTLSLFSVIIKTIY